MAEVEGNVRMHFKILTLIIIKLNYLRIDCASNNEKETKTK
jgi:hypothetical protein